MTATTSIPKTQKACVTKKKGPDYEVQVVEDHPVPEPGQGEILVRITSSGVCHSDLSAIDGSWNDMCTSNICGHEGSGYIVKNGPGVDEVKYPVGTKVGIPIMQKPCLNCDECNEPGGEIYCQNTTMLSTGADGTWQQYTIIYSTYVVPLPEGVDTAIVGPVLCGGVTAYKALKVSNARAGDWVVVTGAGGGLGSFALQYGKALGFRIIAIDTGADKEKLCLELGAEEFVDFANGKILETIQKITAGKGAKAVIGLAPNEQAYNESLTYLGFHGTLVCVGLPHMAAKVAFHPFLPVLRDIRIVGSFIGTRSDIAEALSFVARGKVTPKVEVYPMSEISNVLKAMSDHTLVGRAVIKLD